jgi:hypothetical protein
VTLLAASEQLAKLSFLHALKHQLIAAAATTGAGLPPHVSTNGSNLPSLLLHELSLAVTKSYWKSDLSELIEDEDREVPDHAKRDGQASGGHNWLDVKKVLDLRIISMVLHPRRAGYGFGLLREA